jgi:hypothetical protein
MIIYDKDKRKVMEYFVEENKLVVLVDDELITYFLK